MQQVDNIIIGAGPGGYELAARLAHRGESVAIVERDQPGGTCLNRGCIPTKCLCTSAEVASSVAEAARFGINTDAPSVDYPAVIRRMNDVVDGLRQGVMAELAKCTYIEGEAVLLDSTTVAVGDQTFQASKRIVIATGSKPAVLPIPGAELAMTSDEVLTDSHLPESIAIIGGGVIGMEFASIFNALGVKVTVIEFCKEILPPFEPEIAKRLRTGLSRKGIDIIVGAAVTRLDKNADNSIAIEYQGKRGAASLNAERVVMAVGRRPVLPEGLDKAGVQLTAKGFIEVDELMRTSAAGIYAIGDVNGLSMLAHSAIAQGRVVADANPTAFRRDCIPSVVFTSPEVAMVGPTTAQLETAGEVCRVVKRQFASNGKACAMGQSEGTARLTVRESDNVLLSATIIGPHASNLIAEATILIADQCPITQIGRRYIHAHPTLSEIFV